MLVWVCVVFSGPSFGLTEAPDREPIVDGRYVHNVGQIWHHVTNWSMIGSAPTVPTSFSDAPSAMWPAGSGDEYLWAAGIWVGGQVLEESLVSTGGFSPEFLPTEAEADSIYPTFSGDTGGARYPWANPDDDGDGLEDEDIPNGLDDDGDGLVDEDFAAIGDQHFFCSYSDFEAALQEYQPDHNPLNLAITQQSMQWSDPEFNEFVGYDFTITNKGVVAIENVYLGMFSDFDIGSRGNPASAGDDHAGFVSEQVQLADGTPFSLNISYMYDGATSGALDGYVGWVLLGHPTDSLGVQAPQQVGVRNFQRYSGNAAYGQGGDPTNDFERYETLSGDDWDSDTLPGMSNDYRTLMSSGPFVSLEPGASMSYQVALVVGDGFEGMVANAIGAVEVFRGVDYDRDEDPSNGAEFTVHWINPNNAPVAAHAGHVLARVVPEGVELIIESNVAQGSGLKLVRQADVQDAGNSWTSDQWETLDARGSDFRYRVLDQDQVGFPRVYELVFEASGASQTLDEASLQMPAVQLLKLSASPNPFNPKVNLRLSVPESEKALVQVFDIKGRLVTTLWDGPFAQREETLSWQGTNDHGQAMASGVYEVRLITAEGAVNKRVTLLR